MKIKIKVTKEILRRSMWCDTDKCKEPISKNCAIALAIRDILPDAVVSGDHIRRKWEVSFDINNGIDLPLIAQLFIKRFDSLREHPTNRQLMEPIEFEVDIPEYWFDDVSIYEAINIINKSKTIELC